MYSTKRELALVAAFYAGLAILYTWPLAGRMTSMVPATGDGAAALTGIYVLTWGIHALANHPLGYFQANVFYPHGESLAFGEHLLGLAVPMAPVQWLLASPILTYNLALLFTFVASGCGAYFLVRQSTDSARPGLLAGLLFAFSPFRFQNAGSLSILALHGIPWVFILGHLYLDTGRRRLIYLGVFFTLAQVLSSMFSIYYLVISALLAASMVLLRQRRRPPGLLWRHRLHFATATALLALMLYPFLKPYLNHEFEFASLSGGTIESDGALSVPDPVPVASAGIISSIFLDTTPGSHPLFPGMVAILLIGLLFVESMKGRFEGDHRAFFYTALAATALGMALVFRLRFGGLLTFCVAVLAGLGCGRLEHHLRAIPRGSWLASLLVLVAALELQPEPIQLLEPMPRGGPPLVYRWLNETDVENAVAEIPAAPPGARTPATFARRMLYSTHHWHPVVDGASTWTSPLVQAQRARLRGFPDDASIAQLRALRVDYLIVHLDEYPESEREILMDRIRRRSELILDRRFEDKIVYRLGL